MKPALEIPHVAIYRGDCREILRSFPAESIDCCVTSPPYWGLRDYGSKTQIGLEKMPADYVASLVEVFSEVRRVLVDGGTLWLNLGDSYATDAGKCFNPGGGDESLSGHRRLKETGAYPLNRPNLSDLRMMNLKPKDLVGIPWAVAFALRADGWYLRSDIVWSKPNVMPESVTDRPTKSHEYLFLLSKSERYYYNAAAIAEPCQSGPSDIKKMREKLPRIGGKHKTLIDPLQKSSSTTNIGQRRSVGNGETRNKRSVWEVSTRNDPGEHFASYPEELILPCILAGCPPKGTVLDPFLGSGTTALVARINACNTIGIEINPSYIDLASRRLAQDVLEFFE